MGVYNTIQRSSAPKVPHVTEYEDTQLYVSPERLPQQDSKRMNESVAIGSQPADVA